MSIMPSSQKDREKVIAAIIAGVSACIEEEEKASELVMTQRRPAMAVSLWTVFGREEIMRMRNLWQRRIA
jgi:hypothetical protein